MASRGDALLNRRPRGWIESDMTKSGMNVVSKRLGISQTAMDRMNPGVFRALLAVFFGLTMGTLAVRSQDAVLAHAGVAWQARGTWRIDGITGSIQTGDAIP